MLSTVAVVTAHLTRRAYAGTTETLCVHACASAADAALVRQALVDCGAATDILARINKEQSRDAMQFYRCTFEVSIVPFGMPGEADMVAESIRRAIVLTGDL